MNKTEKYYVAAYFNEHKQGLDDNLATNDFEQAVMFAHDCLCNGNFVEIKNKVTGKSHTYTPGEWLKCINLGDIPASVKELA